MTVDQLEAAWTPRTKVLLFVSPSNPTGAVYLREEIEAIGRWAAGRGLWVVTDEIYEHLVYDGVEHHSMPVVVPELAERCIVVNGVAKTYAMTGWRVGWMIGPADVVAAATNLQSQRPPTWPTSPSGPPWPPCPATSRRWTDAQAFDRRRRRSTGCSTRSTASSAAVPEGAFYAFP